MLRNILYHEKKLMRVWAMWYNEHNWPGVHAISSRFLGFRIILQLYLSWYGTWILTLKRAIVHMSDSFQCQNQTIKFTNTVLKTKIFIGYVTVTEAYIQSECYHYILLNNRWQLLVTNLQLKSVLTHWGRNKMDALADNIFIPSFLNKNANTLLKFHRNVFMDTW